MRSVLMMLGVATLLACSDRPADRGANAEPPETDLVSLDIPDPIPCDMNEMQYCARTGDVYIGGQPSESALESFAALGVTTVVSTRAEDEIDWDERARVEALGMKFVRIPMPGPVTEISDEQVMRLDSVLEYSQEPVLLHCGSGNRVSGLWGSWLAAERGVEPAEALRLAEMAGLRSVKPVVEQRLGLEPATP